MHYNPHQLNRERLARIKEDGMSHGMETFIDAIEQAQRFNATQPQVRRNGEEYRKKLVTVYFSWVTDNRLMAHIITNDCDNPRLERLVIPEAGHRLYANYKDGYQANGYGYDKRYHILEAMVFQVGKHIDMSKTRHWSEYIKAEVIA